jgi:hypothetical protein
LWTGIVQTVGAGKAERVLSEESTQSHGSVEGPDPLICPISFELMTDPVIAADGNTYQRDAIKQWFEECQSGKWAQSLAPLVKLSYLPCVVGTTQTIRSYGSRYRAFWPPGTHWHVQIVR